ncbi:DUF6531 domain-containing protein [Streptomyces sp. HGB0020]|uniref:DUF6531 domain-containing protein n=1 Tax=Streptomyces sp. HGB0020 TaxID=1078086 RepID=UPI00034E9D0C|nr:DUF6531 domain-containing protein [Streptomyces sp. HGB0020]EPD55799.1 YD repeat (two copies) [Streptomyces sp. HGB0020]
MAGNRPRDWHVLDLDKDPTPGDPDRVRTLARTLHDFADDVSDALKIVKGMAEEDTALKWAGKSADVFKDEFSDVPKNLKKLKKSYEMCGDALAAYWPKLERAQALADRALAKGREAQHDLSSAKSRLSSADSWVTRAGREADKYKDDPTGSKSGADKPDESKVRAATRDVQHAKSAQTKAQSDVNSAQDALSAAKKMAEDARKMREDAAREAKNKIDDASDAGIQNRSWWEDVGDWFEDNWDTIVTVCKVVVTVVGIVAMIIGGPILGAIVLVAALVVLADTLYKYSKGQASLWDVGFAALDCIPGMKGLTSLGKLAKGAKGLKAMRLKGMATAVRGLAKNGRAAIEDGAKGAYSRAKSLIKRCGDPVDPATGYMYMEQTDISLPGTLPFAFARRVSSGYYSGWWFGSSWASTIDQRLETDERGVVFVTEDGMLLTYPHPEQPDAPVLPESGPRRPLSLLGHGGYRITDPGTGQTRQFASPVDGKALLERITDRNHNTITFDYDSEGTPVAMRHSGGYCVRFTVEGQRITALHLTGPAGDDAEPEVVVKRYGYVDGNLVEVINSSGKPLRFTYDERLRITSWEDTNHHRYRYEYDHQDRCTEQGGEAGHLANFFKYDVLNPAWPNRRITEVTTGAGATSRFVIDDACLVVAEVDPSGHTVRHAFDSRNQLIARTDAQGHVTRYTWDENGNLIGVEHADGARTFMAYNEFGQPVEIVQPGGGFWRYTYDDRGNHLTTLTPDSALTRFSYDDSGHRTAITDALGSTAVVECDRAGLPLRVIDAAGGVTRYKRDIFGRPVKVIDLAGATTHLEWTVEGLVSRRVAPDGSTECWTYDGEGNCTSHTDAIGGVTTFEYTHFDLLAVRTAPDGARYVFEHDPELRLRKVVDPLGMEWTYEYDLSGRLIAETDFDDRTYTYTHDASGRLTARTTPSGQTIHYGRDPLGRVVLKNAAGDVTTYAYDAAGDLVEASGPDAILTLERDREGRVISETVNDRTVIYTYDALGRRAGRTTPSGAVSNWSYDASGNRVVLATSGRLLSFTYDAAGRELSRRIGENVALEQGFDAMGRLTRQDMIGPGESPIQSRTYAYREDGYLVASTDQLNGTQWFDLDAAGRVTGVRAAGWTETYAYDAAGNQIQASWPAGMPGQDATGTRSYVGTRIRAAGSVRYEYDDAGRMALRQKTRLSRKPDTWRYFWDAEDRLTAVVTPDGTHWRYRYDPLGRRIAKQRLDEAGEAVVEQVNFAWDGTTLCEQTSLWSGASEAVTLTWDHDGLHPLVQTERKMVLGGDSASQQEIDCRFYAIVTDLVGAPTELLDEHGEIAWRRRTTLWGGTAWNRGALAYTPLRYPGHYNDPEAGLHYNYFRHYDPETARYLTPDPLGLSPAPNPVTYVHNPHTWADPLGLSPCNDEILPEGYTSSPALERDPYHPDMVAQRRADNAELYAASPADRAAELGYKRRISPQKAPFNSHGQEVFSNGKNYITPDVDGHNVSDGWKMFNKKGQRIGTYDADLNYIKK